eukprot:m.89284 g.89284  ORF g.89284 m.89284 type:complete len:225 (+) comp26281_c0_seq1:120-794(+)
MESGNPWVLSGESVLSGVVQLGDLDRVLSLAQASGHVTAEQRTECFEPSSRSSASHGVPHLNRTRHRSKQLIELMTKATVLDNRTHKLRLKAWQQKLARNSADFTHPAFLEKKMETLKQLSSHLTLVQNSFPELDSRYHGRPFEQEHLMIEAEFHSTLGQLLPMVGESLANVGEYCRLLDQARDEIKSPSIEMDESIIALPTQINSLMDYFQALQRARHHSSHP